MAPKIPGLTWPVELDRSVRSVSVSSVGDMPRMLFRLVKSLGISGALPPTSGISGFGGSEEFVPHPGAARSGYTSTDSFVPSPSRMGSAAVGSQRPQKGGAGKLGSLPEEQVLPQTGTLGFVDAVAAPTSFEKGQTLEVWSDSKQAGGGGIGGKQRGVNDVDVIGI
eukprot:s2117_g3.t1